MKNWNVNKNEMPQFDGDYLCWINETQECGAIHEYYKVVTCQNNIWLVGVLQFVKAWKELPSNTFDENVRMNLKNINSGIVQEKLSLKDSLWRFLRNEHDLILLDSEVFEIIYLIDKFRSENQS